MSQKAIGNNFFANAAKRSQYGFIRNVATSMQERLFENVAKSRKSICLKTNVIVARTLL